jgi:putative ABC transport system permease protein
MPLTDILQAVRRIRRQPAFAAAVVAVLAMAIGANTAMFALVHAILIRPLPLADPDRLVTFTIVRPGNDRQPLSIADMNDFAESNRTLDGVASAFGWSANLTGRGDAERLSAMRVSSNYFAVTGGQVQVGRLLQAGDEDRAAALIGHGLWLRYFGGNADAIGQSMVLNGEAFTIVGALRPDFVSSSAMPRLWCRTRRPAIRGAATAPRDSFERSRGRSPASRRHKRTTISQPLAAGCVTNIPIRTARTPPSGSCLCARK